MALWPRGGCSSGRHEGCFASQKTLFPFRTSMLKVTVNLSPAFGARTQTVWVRRTPLGYHVHNLFRCSRSIVDFLFSFFYTSVLHFFVFQEIG